MTSSIFILEEGVPDMRRVAEYSLPPKEAMVSYIKQYVEKDFNTFNYPKTIKGMRESQTIKDHWYFDLYRGRNGGRINAVIAAYPNEQKTCLIGGKYGTYQRKRI